MGVRKRGNKWQARIQRRNMPSIAKSFINKADAERWARQTEVEIDRGTHISRTEAEKTTLHDALERYLAEVTQNKKGAKQERYRIAVIMRSKLAKQSVAKIRSTDVAKYRDERIKTVAANTVKNELNTLSAVFECARLEWGINITNPVRGLKRPITPAGRDRRLLDMEEKYLLITLF